MYLIDLKSGRVVISQKWTMGLPELVPPLKQPLNWQKLKEPTFLEFWHLVKCLQQLEEFLVKKKSY